MAPLGPGRRGRHAGGSEAAETGGSAPLYLRVAQRLLEQIQSGDYPVGALLPTEMELAALHGVSRQTVRQAIAQLRQKGLVSARKGVGTRVESIRAARRFNYSVHSVEDLFHLAADTELEVKARAPFIARGRTASLLGCRSGHRWLHLSCRRVIAGESRPLAWTDIYVDGRLASAVREQSHFRSALFALLEKQSGETLAEIQQEIRAVVLEPEMAERLEAAPGAPALQITRRYFSTGRRLLEVSVNTLPADRFFYSVEILREEA